VARHYSRGQPFQVLLFQDGMDPPLMTSQNRTAMVVMSALGESFKSTFNPRRARVNADTSWLEPAKWWVAHTLLLLIAEQPLVSDAEFAMAAAAEFPSTCPLVVDSVRIQPKATSGFASSVATSGSTYLRPEPRTQSFRADSR
jgi:hypothetical protein